jgi:hypothetical protein
MIDAETIYLGVKIEQGFVLLAKAIQSSSLGLIDTIRSREHLDPSLATICSHLSAIAANYSGETRVAKVPAEINRLTQTLRELLAKPETLKTPNEIARESA